MTSQRLWTPTQVFHLWQGAVNEWWIASEQSAVVQHSQAVEKYSLPTCLLYSQGRCLFPDPNLQINEACMALRCPGVVCWTVRLTGSGWVGDWRAETGRWWSVGTWLGGFTANCLQAGEFNPAGKAQSRSAVTIRKLWGHFMSMSIRTTQSLQYEAPKAVLRLSTTGVFKLFEAIDPLGW